MATSGYTDVAVANYITLRFSWSAGTQNITNNYTPVSWKLQLISSNSTANISSTVNKDYSVTVDGTTVSGTNTIGLSGGATKTLASGSKNIYHSSDGTKTFNYSFSQEIGITYSGTAIGTKTGSGSGTLNTIPRGSVLGTISDFTLGNAITVPITKYSSSFADTLTISVGGTTVKTVSSVANGASVSFTSAELTSIYGKLPNATSGVFTFTLTTKNGTTTIGTSTKTAKGTIPNTVIPSISSVSLVENTSGLATQFGAYIQNKSTIKGTVSATAGTGTTIDNYKITINGATYTNSTFTTGVLKTSGSNSYSVTVTDKRGRTASTSGTFTVTAYTSPTISNFSVVRCNSNGTENNEGAYAKVNATATITSLSSKNTKTFVLQYKLNNTSTWTTLETYTAAYTYTITNKIIPNISVDNPYDFRIVATDYFGAVNSKIIALSSAYTILDILANGKGVAFGKVASESGVLDIGFAETVLSPNIFLGGEKNNDEEKNIRFGTKEDATYPSNCKLYGGNGNSATGIGMWDEGNSRQIFTYQPDSKAFTFGGDIKLLRGGSNIIHDIVRTTGENTGSFHYSNGLLIQYGKVIVTPTAANTTTNINVVFPISYTQKPNLFIEAQTSVPNGQTISVGQGGTNVTDFGIYMNKASTAATTIHWLSIGYKGV